MDEKGKALLIGDFQVHWCLPPTSPIAHTPHTHLHVHTHTHTHDTHTHIHTLPMRACTHTHVTVLFLSYFKEGAFSCVTTQVWSHRWTKEATPNDIMGKKTNSAESSLSCPQSPRCPGAVDSPPCIPGSSQNANVQRGQADECHLRGPLGGEDAERGWKARWHG